MDNNLTIIKTEENIFEFKIEMTGFSTNKMAVCFMIDTKKMLLGFMATSDDSIWQVKIPPLSMLENEAVYDYYVDVNINAYHFEPIKGSITALDTQNMPEIEISVPKNVTFVEPEKQEQSKKDKEEKKEEKKEEVKVQPTFIKTEEKKEPKKEEKAVKENSKFTGILASLKSFAITKEEVTENKITDLIASLKVSTPTPLVAPTSPIEIPPPIELKKIGTKNEAEQSDLDKTVLSILTENEKHETKKKRKKLH